MAYNNRHAHTHTCERWSLVIVWIMNESLVWLSKKFNLQFIIRQSEQFKSIHRTSSEPHASWVCVGSLKFNDFVIIQLFTPLNQQPNVTGFMQSSMSFVGVLELELFERFQSSNNEVKSEFFMGHMRNSLKIHEIPIILKNTHYSQKYTCRYVYTIIHKRNVITVFLSKRA